MNKWRVSFGDLVIGDIAKKYFQKVFDKNWASEGDNVKEFEGKFAAKFGCKHAIATSSGTDADIVSCAALYDYDANRGDEVIVPSHTFVATWLAVSAVGAIAVPVEAAVGCYNMDTTSAEAHITPRTKAILPVHLYGIPADMDAICQLAKKHGLVVIEDACHALGAEYKGKKVGSIGDIGTYSFFMSHHITTIEGGMVMTDNEEFAEMARAILLVSFRAISADFRSWAILARSSGLLFTRISSML